MKRQKEEITHLIDPRITEIIQNLRDQNFGSKEQRSMFVDLISTLATTRDPRGKKTIKKLGDILSDIGDELMQEEVYKWKYSKKTYIKD